MKNLSKSIVVLFLVVFTSCASVTSNTIIEPNNSFVLGNNAHGIFKVKVRNVSKNNLEIYHAPIEGGKHSSQIIIPNQQVILKVDANTALYIKNTATEQASVDLYVTGDTSLSMDYKK